MYDANGHHAHASVANQMLEAQSKKVKDEFRKEFGQVHAGIAELVQAGQASK